MACIQSFFYASFSNPHRTFKISLMMLFFYVQADKQTVQEQNKPEFLKVALRKTPVAQSS